MPFLPPNQQRQSIERHTFDGVNHTKLLKLLLDRGLPSHVIKILINWYSKKNFLPSVL